MVRKKITNSNILIFSSSLFIIFVQSNSCALSCSFVGGLELNSSFVKNLCFCHSASNSHLNLLMTKLKLLLPLLLTAFITMFMFEETYKYGVKIHEKCKKYWLLGGGDFYCLKYYHFITRKIIRIKN